MTDSDLPHRILVALQAARSPLADGLQVADIRALADTGLAHAHFLLGRHRVLARVPKQSQMQLQADRNLVYQQACFERAAPGGHSPALIGVLPVSANLPRGALLVEKIDGRPATLPGDLDAIMRALASIHALPLLPPERQAPLLAPQDPLAAMLDEIDSQANHLDTNGIHDDSRRAIRSTVADVRQQAGTMQRGNDSAVATVPVTTLVAYDAHPGNYLIRADGSAVLVDLEKARYGYPAVDIAHATLYTSTTWDIHQRVVLDVPTIAHAYRHWAGALGADKAGPASEWLTLRKAMWLWSVTWCAKWKAQSQQSADLTRAGEDWSAQLSEDKLVAHVRDRVEHYLTPETIARVLAEFKLLAGE